MGIKNLRKFLRKRSENYEHPINLSKYKYKKVAIDISPYLYKYKAISEFWISSFINMIICMRKNDIHCVFIYDSKPPKEKKKELESRMNQKDKLKNKIIDLGISLENYYNNGEISETLKNNMIDKNKPISLLQKRMEGKDTNKKDIDELDITFAEMKLKKIKNQLISLTKKDISLTKKILNLLKIPHFNAPDEAERFCAQLCVNGIVDAVLSEDTDVLAYGTPFFLSKINIYSGICYEVEFKNILSILNFSKVQQFQDFCIMCGTDYNSNIFKTGPEKAYPLLLKYENIENMAYALGKDISILNHIKVRELFSTPEKMNTNIPYCKKPDFIAFQRFIFENNIKVNMNSMIDAFSSKVVFE